MIDLIFMLRRDLPRREAGQSTGRRLAEVLRRAVLDQSLTAGGVLPASRVLAHELGVARNTVLYAYEQLTAEGFVRADRQGTVVCHLGSTMPAGSAAHRARLPPLAHRARPVDLPLEGGSPRPFEPGVPALDAFPLKRWRQYAIQAWKAMTPAMLDRRVVAGEPVLRVAIAGYLRASRGVRCEPEQVIITSGTQESLILCAQLLADPGERAWMEHPGYLGAIYAFAAAGLALVPVPVDEQGLAPSPALWKNKPPRLIYTTPSHQYPQGVMLSLPRRLALIERAREHGSWIIEDDYDSEFCRGMPLAAMQGLAPDAPVVYLGTFSKTLYPALRLAFVVLPQAVVEQIVPALGGRLSPGRAAEQEALAAFIHQGDFTAHLRQMRRLYAEREAALRAALEAHWPLSLTLSPGAGGMHLSLVLPTHVSDLEVVRRAASRGLEPRALSTFSVHGGRPLNGLVLGYANIASERMGEHVASLAAVVRQVSRKRRG